MDRGWRRSGTLLYMPDVSRSCCPHYTIRYEQQLCSKVSIKVLNHINRLPSADFKPSRDQRQALNRWNRFVLGDKYIQELERKHPKTKAEKKAQESYFNLPTTVHASELSTLKPDIIPEHNFAVTLEPDTFTEEKYALFANYQKHVHHEQGSEISRPGFKRFLCSSPLHRHPDPADGKDLGSYHQCYRLDGRLIALAVLDRLPHAVSGVYFLYHSDFAKWSFGKLSALREAALAGEGGYRYYYMGYYIHSCKKMRYKGDYRPQYVLDYASGGWDVLDQEMRGCMEGRGWASMSRERARKERNGAGVSAEEEGESEERAVNANGTATALSTPVPSSGEQAADATTRDDHDELEDDTDELVLHPTPTAACASGLSLLELGMPGILTLEEVLGRVDLDAMKLFLGGKGGDVHEMRDLVSWGEEDDDDGDGDGDGDDRPLPQQLKRMSGMMKTIAEFAAVVGSEVARGIVVDFSRG
ncbi:Arginyl-tRNA--protein transferase 1 [Recurvomyces mirabilis]|uniref:arginyltransferase n=1 Tax=Recurvomyces mirabilis TaxID=574656 RepID=A0AAE0TRL8_9PEZI|nr:Arginyl-tRNA--protein transferase 1 [Recurvomyces mirabilis]KAK5158232.1 Arginyl-tRNA--protein transferase 1 [Recurvomyces mirabilis]